MSSKSLKIAAIQMTTGISFQDNLEQATKLISSAVESGANFIVLPEYFALMGKHETDKFEFIEQHLSGPMQALVSQLAKQYCVWIVAGTHPIESEELDRPFGRTYVFNSIGEVVTWYDKIHLFDVTVGDNQGCYRESKYTKAGDRVISFDSPWGKIGLSVCYDLRFPELFRILSDEGCEVLLMPAAFTYKTGKMHWEVLIKARAIENLCYFVASAQSGIHDNGRETWGHSCIISPWGKVIDEVEKGVGFAIATVDRVKQSNQRKEFPVLSHKKL